MILPKAKCTAAEPKTITMADGQTFTVLVSKPSFEQRFIDEGNEVRAYHGTDPDAWPQYRLGRIRMAIVDWQNMENEKGQAIPFTAQRLFGLMEAAPEVVTQIVALANEAFRPLVLVPNPPETPETSGATVETAETSPASSASTSDTSAPSSSPTTSESVPAS